MRLLAAALLVCSACDVKLNRGPHLPTAPGEDTARPHGGVEIAANDPPKLALPLPPPSVQYAEEKYPRAMGAAEPRDDLMVSDDDPIPPEVRRLGPEAIAAYQDLLDQADPKQLYMKADQLKESDPEHAIPLLKQAVARTKPNEVVHVKAANLLAQLGGKRPANADDAKMSYLHGYQLKAEQPDQAILEFKRVISLVPADDEYHGKAMAELARLGVPLKCIGRNHRAQFVLNTKDLEGAVSKLAQWRYDVLKQPDGTFTIVICS